LGWMHAALGMGAYRGIERRAYLCWASGDVLPVAFFDAAIYDVYVHGAVGEQWRARHGNTGLLAGNLADLIPDVVGALSA